MQPSTLSLNQTVSGALRLPGRPPVSPASASSVTDRDLKHVRRFTACLRALGWISLLSLLLASVPVAWETGYSAAADLAGSQGEFNGDLEFLARCYAAPATAGESNCTFDLWKGHSFRRTVSDSGLTNNMALLINSHGLGLKTAAGQRYALFPHDARLAPGQATSYFSVADLAKVMGAERAAQIHNIVIGGCNEDGALSPQEFRTHFVNATNITHMAAGELGCQPMLLQALMTESQNVQSIYESAVKQAGTSSQWITARKPKGQSVRYGPYVAEIFRPGARTPFKKQIAGREILDPTRAPLPDLTATLFETNPLTSLQQRW